MPDRILALTEQLQTLSAHVRAERLRNRTAVSQADKAVALLYHKIELENFNAVGGYLLAKQLKEALIKRRRMKLQTHILDVLANYLEPADKRLAKKVKAYAAVAALAAAAPASTTPV